MRFPCSVYRAGLRRLLDRAHVGTDVCPLYSRRARYLGSMSTLAFILTFVVPIPSLAKRKLGHYHNAQFFVLVITYMAMLLFAGFYSHFLIQAVVTLQQ
jgi:hypothetical protein